MEERTRGDGDKGVTMARGDEGAGVGATLPVLGGPRALAKMGSWYSASEL